MLEFCLGLLIGLIVCFVLVMIIGRKNRIKDEETSQNLSQKLTYYWKENNRLNEEKLDVLKKIGRNLRKK